MMGVSQTGVFEQIERLYRDGTLAGLEDAELLERYLTERDEDAFETLVKVHGPMVLGLCRRMLREPKDIEDAFQATFLVLVRKAPRIRDRELLANWLYGVAYRVATRARSDVLRRRGREIAVANLEAPMESQSIDLVEIGPVLDRELNRLPRKYRAALVSCYLGGQTHEQAAKALSCPVGTIRSRLARGRDILRKRLTRLGYAPTGAVLGPGTGLPTKLLGEAVPPALVAATVKAGVAIGISNTIHAGASSASVLALTQGVLTTMKFAQLKWIGLAVAATTLSAGGVITVSYASAHDRGERAAAPAEAQAPGARTDGGSGAVLSETEMERKIDELLTEIGYFASDDPIKGRAGDGSLAAKVLKRKLLPLLAAPGRTRLGRGEVATDQAAPDTVGVATAKPGIRSETVPGNVMKAEVAREDSTAYSRSSVHELEADLRLAIKNYERTRALRQQASVSQADLDADMGRVQHLIAILEGLRDDLSDESARLQLEKMKKQAELDQAVAHREGNATKVARHKQLNDRKPGMVAASDVEGAEAELREAGAGVEIKKVELQLVKLRTTQVKRQSELVEQVLSLAAPLKATQDPRSRSLEAAP
jgi:RNA polymerase sigma factor (sigma-70 family)